jgi:hypothetical protein
VALRRYLSSQLVQMVFEELCAAAVHFVANNFLKVGTLFSFKKY